MIRFATTNDACFISNILMEHPDACEVKYTPDMARRIISTPGIIHIIWDMGVFQFVPLNGRTMILHPCGKGASRHIAKALEMVGAKKYVGFVPENNLRASGFFLSAGFVNEGQMKNSIEVNGKVLSQTIYGKEA